MSEPTTLSSAVVLHADELPAACPNPRMPLWSSHPKVYLELSHGRARCPYCGTQYQLAEGVHAQGH
jgi:uncharacterized Zn-finger protein